MIRRRSLRTRAIKMLVLDEADEMLNKGEAERGVTVTQCDGMGHMSQVICSGVLTMCSRSRFLTPGLMDPCSPQVLRNRSTTCTATCLQPHRWF